MMFRKTITFFDFAAAGCLLLCSVFFSPAHASSRIKDIADFEGVRDNQLVGYGLIVGLNGTGDNIKSIDFTKESLISMLDQIGINARGRANQVQECGGGHGNGKPAGLCPPGKPH